MNRFWNYSYEPLKTSFLRAFATIGVVLVHFYMCIESDYINQNKVKIVKFVLIITLVSYCVDTVFRPYFRRTFVNYVVKLPFTYLFMILPFFLIIFSDSSFSYIFYLGIFCCILILNFLFYIF